MTDRLVVATSLILLSHGWVLKGYLSRKGGTPAVYAASLVETAVNGRATPGRRAWERRRGWAKRCGGHRTAGSVA